MLHFGGLATSLRGTSSCLFFPAINYFSLSAEVLITAASLLMGAAFCCSWQGPRRLSPFGDISLPRLIFWTFLLSNQNGGKKIYMYKRRREKARSPASALQWALSSCVVFYSQIGPMFTPVTMVMSCSLQSHFLPSLSSTGNLHFITFPWRLLFLATQLHFFHWMNRLAF